MRQLFLVCVVFMISSCYRDPIQFEGDPPDSYTRVVKIDTITPFISTVIVDSFATGNTNSFLVGRYNDPHFGEITSRAFLQIGMPGTTEDIADNAVFDSLVLIIRLDKYYYGDTTKAITLEVHELDESIELGYNDQLYNTSNFSIKPSPLGSKQVRIYPHLTDSVIIRLDQAKGQEIFSKIRSKADELNSQDNFLLYFKGIRVSTTHDSEGVVYGLKGEGGSMVMRLHYHLTAPFPKEEYVDFTSLANDRAFRQTLVNRNGSLPDPAMAGKHELSSAETNHIGYTQPTTGVLMKIIFPGLQNILNTDKPVNLLRAEILLRPLSQSFDIYSLPPSLMLMQTDESNIVGSPLADSTGFSILTATPVLDHIYGTNNYYRFNITNFIRHLLQTPASAGVGFFVTQSTPEQSTQLNRAVFGDAAIGKNASQLSISIVTVNLE
jgi:hypothetical protein